MKECCCGEQAVDEGFKDNAEDHEANAKKHWLIEYSASRQHIIDYFSTSFTLLHSSNPSTIKPFYPFSSPTTAFHLAIKSSL